ncbi:hypothetical protein [Luteolibacter sp. Populi]|uniref:hypothetical protein n=1 Tax=Luteolibacter sp. Populi TaxID=3230487 RepID=UPI003464F49F
MKPANPADREPGQLDAARLRHGEDELVQPCGIGQQDRGKPLDDLLILRAGLHQLRDLGASLRCAAGKRGQADDLRIVRQGRGFDCWRRRGCRGIFRGRRLAGDAADPDRYPCTCHYGQDPAEQSR